MESIKKFIHSIRIIFTMFSLIVIMNNSIFGACFGGPQRGGGFFGSPQNCTWKRGDNRCNDDSECCPGYECSANTGQCQPCCKDC